MITLDQIPDDTRQNLIALPYRVGLYISQIDTTGGDESSEQEIRALQNIFTYYVEDTLKSEFSQTVMQAAIQRKHEWNNWNGGLDKVPQDCVELTQYLEGRLNKRDLTAFKNNLLDIAIAVAMAYCENPQPLSFKENLKAFFENLFTPKSKHIESDVFSTQHLNISPSEKKAINDLAKLLNIAHKVF